MRHTLDSSARLCAWLLVGLLVLGGCASQQKKKTKAAEPTKMEEPAAMEPMPMPEPMSGRNMGTLYVPTGEAATSAIALIKRGPSEVNLGAPFEYTITAENLTAGQLNGVVVSDMLPEGMRMVGSDPEASASNPMNPSWNLGNMRPGETRVIRVTAVADRQGSLRHCAEVTYNQNICIYTDVVEPALQVTKRMTPEVVTCDDIEMVCTVTNNGTGVARNVVMSCDCPNGMMAADGSNTSSMNIGDLAAGESREFRKMMRVSASGEYECTCTATADGGLEASASAKTIATQPMLEITKTGPELVYRDKQVSYEITVRNTGDGPCRDARVMDMIPASTTYESSSPSGTFDGANLTWNVGTLQPGDERTFRVTVRANEIRSITNRARAMGYCADEVNAEVTTQVKGIPAILLEVIDVEDPIPVGTNVTYVIRVTNQGSADDTNINILCELEDQMGYVSSSGATSGDGSATQVDFQPLGRLAPGAVAEWRIVINAKDEGDVRFKVTMTSDNINRPVQETEATNFYK